MEASYLECPICYVSYNEEGKNVPVVFGNCGHSSCSECIHHMTSSSSTSSHHSTYSNMTIKCPCCSIISSLPLPKNYALLNLINKEKRSSSTSSSFHNNTSSTSSTMTKSPRPSSIHTETNVCRDHNRAVDIYCYACNEGICTYCDYGRHKHHQKDLLRNCLPHLYTNYTHAIDKMQKDLDRMYTYLEKQKHHANELHQSYLDSKTQINEHCDELVNAIENERRILLHQLDSEYHSLTDYHQQEMMLVENMKGIYDYCVHESKRFEPENLSSQLTEFLISTQTIESAMKTEVAVCEINPVQVELQRTHHRIKVGRVMEFHPQEKRYLVCGLNGDMPSDRESGLYRQNSRGGISDRDRFVHPKTPRFFFENSFHSESDGGNERLSQSQSQHHQHQQGEGVRVSHARSMSYNIASSLSQQLHHPHQRTHPDNKPYDEEYDVSESGDDDIDEIESDHTEEN